MHPSQRAAAIYQGSTGQRYHVGKRGVPSEALPWIYQVRAALFQGYLQPTDTVLEWGCGAGWNLAGLRTGRRVGMDVEPALQGEVEASGAEFVATTRTFADATFSVVISHHSLEHAPEPLAALIELQRLLRPGGLLLLAVPYETHSRQRRYRSDEPNHHLYSWNPQTLGNLVALTGLEIRSVRLRTYGYDRAAASWAVRFHLGELGFRVLRLLARLLRPLREVVLEARRPSLPN